MNSGFHVLIQVKVADPRCLSFLAKNKGLLPTRQKENCPYFYFSITNTVATFVIPTCGCQVSDET